MDRREYVCNQMYKQHDLLRKGSWTDADKLEYMELNIAPYSRYWRMGMKKALKHAIRLLREEEAKADRKTENNSEKPNNCEPQYEVGMGTLKCDNCSEYGSFKCTKCDGEMYFKRLEPKDEPQTYVINPQEPTNDDKCFECDDFFTCGGQCNKIEDEPQTDCAWK